MEVNQQARGIFRSLWGCSAPAWDQSTVWLWKSSGEDKLSGSISYAPLWHGDTALGKALAPFPSALPGSPRPLLRRFIELCGSRKGPDLILWAQLGLPQELCVLHSSQSYSVLPGDTNLNASTSGKVTFVLVPVSTFSLCAEFITEQ